jgi:TnpA family transposase
VQLQGTLRSDHTSDKRTKEGFHLSPERMNGALARAQAATLSVLNDEVSGRWGTICWQAMLPNAPRL